MQTHFSQWKGDTNSFFYVVGGWCILILLHKRVIQTHLTQWDGDTNSFYPVQGWHKLILLQWRKKQTHLTCNESLTQTERWYKFIFLSGRVTLTHFTPWKWHSLILLHGGRNKLTWLERVTMKGWLKLKGDTLSIYSIEEWHKLILLFHGRVTKNQFTLIQVQKRQNFRKINETKFSANDMHIYNTFNSMERWYKLILPCGSVTNSFISMEGWYKLILLNGMVI